MAKYFIIFVLIVVFACGMEFFRKYTLEKLLKELFQAAYVKKDEEAFELLILSPQAKMLMNNSTRYIMQLNYYIASENTDKVLKIIEKLKKTNMNISDRLTYYGNGIGYLSEKEHPKAQNLLEFMREKEKHSKNLQMQLLLLDCEMAIDVYINKNIERISELKMMIDADIDNNAKSIYQYRLAKLYKTTGEFSLCKNMLMNARNNTSSKQAKCKIDRILHGEWELL